MSRPTLSAALACLALAAPAALPAQSVAPSAADPAAAAGDPAPGVRLQILEAGDITLPQFLWTNRVLVVFADTPADPRFISQMQILAQWPRDLVDREVIVITDTDPSAQSPVRQQLRPRDFSIVLVDKDGTVKLRKPSPWHSREIARAIDRTPLRRDEIRERGGGGSGTSG